MKQFLVFLTVLFITTRLLAQVNLQTGSATFSLPVFNWQDDKSRLNTTIALNYNSGNGLKVGDVASNVGQGWNLIAGGVVSRMMVGEPDDQQPRAGGVNDVSKYPAGILYGTSTPEEGCPNALPNYPIYGSKNQLYKQHNFLAEDRELDRFSFSFNGRNGMFVLDWKAFRANGTKNGFSLGDNKLKISFLTSNSMNGFRTTIIGFIIQDENGIRYRFGRPSSVRVLKTNYCDANLQMALTQPHFKSNNVYHESSFHASSQEIPDGSIADSWFLVQMEDALTGRVINFNYNTRIINTATGTSITYNETNNYSVVTHLYTSATTSELLSISCPDDHKVLFSYPNYRYDFPGQFALSNIDVKYKDRFVSRFLLNTGYIIKNRWGIPVTLQQRSMARLYLKSVQKFGVDLKEGDEPYLFDYFMGDNRADAFVPPAYSFAKDIWGFYNGNESRAFDNSPIPLDASINDLDNNQMQGLCFRRPGSNDVVINPKTGYAKWGLLRQIVYPTGGSMRYEYEQNTGMLNGAEREVGGVHVSKTSVTDGGYSNDCDHPIVTNYNYVLADANSTSSLWGLEMPDNDMLSTNKYAPEKKYFYFKPWILKAGCSYRYQYPGLLYREQRYALNTMQQVLQVVSKIMDIVSVITTIVDIANILAATGPGAIVSIIIDAVAFIVNIILTCATDQSSTTTTHLVYNTDLNGSNPLPCQFSRVEVTESPGGRGKTVSEFLSGTDYAVWEASNPEMSMKQRFAYWVYGQPKRNATYSEMGQLLTETNYKYDWLWARQIPGPIKPEKPTYSSCKCLVTTNQSQRNVDWEDPAHYSPANGAYTQDDIPGVMRVKLYSAITGRLPLKRTEERLYKQGGTSSQYAENITEYNYDINNNDYEVRSITTTGSDNITTTKRIKYPNDYYVPGEIQMLKNNNIIAVPIATTMYRTSATGNGSTFNEQITEFTTLPNGDIKPAKTKEQRYATPQSSFTTYDGTNGSNPNYFETQTFHYDGRGNLTGLKDEGKHVVTNIYDYDDKYIVASVINADTTTDKPAYTSFETTNLGGWISSGTSAYQAGGTTGDRSLILNGLTLSAPLNTNKEYRITFWANAAVSVSNGTLLKSDPLINGYRYYEYSIPLGNASISLSGNAVIDELRLYPTNARMRTVTYDPLIGKTSECDENNRITYYEYDAQSRLRFIKDDKRDVVKMYEYNIVRKQQGCPQSFTNPTITEIYTKNDCPSGYVGSDVTYTIPAGRYTSTVSQDEVDQQVQDELDNNAQSYANTHGSCLPLYYNTVLSQQYEKENCPPGYVGGTTTYTVPAGRYTSTTSQADADEKALFELNANGQAFANNDASVSCTYTNAPQWEADEPAQTYCQMGSCGQYTGNLMVLMKDVNPHSSTYNQTQWQNSGPSSSCPVTTGNCSPADCNGPDKRCIADCCEFGFKVYTHSTQNPDGTWFCVYHYEWSDGSWSADYYESSSVGACAISSN